ncbi:hypothetical protein TNCV_4983341 [Trichonephila clavipes]|nr:hypothetical protein TNCV_4983341 [Trichonephila clavipes]
MVLKANDRRTSCPCHDEFRGTRSDYVRQVASENNNNKYIKNAFEAQTFHLRITNRMLESITIAIVPIGLQMDHCGRHFSVNLKAKNHMDYDRVNIYSASGIVVNEADCGAVRPVGSNSGETMDVSMCIVPSWHGGTLNSHRAASPLVRLHEQYLHGQCNGFWSSKDGLHGDHSLDSSIKTRHDSDAFYDKFDTETPPRCLSSIIIDAFVSSGTEESVRNLH